MSQSDYLKYKIISTELKLDASRLPSTLNSQSYTQLKKYSLENKITNTKTIYNKITPTGKHVVFDMEKVITNCPTFIVCKNTNQRPNRVPMSDVYYTPTPMPLTIKDTKNASNQKNGCKCIMNSKYTNSPLYHNVCKCVLGNFGIVR